LESGFGLERSGVFGNDVFGSFVYQIIHEWFFPLDFSAPNLTLRVGQFDIGQRGISQRFNPIPAHGSQDFRGFLALLDADGIFPAPDGMLDVGIANQKHGRGFGLVVRLILILI
jgi:hypothetical protein